MLLHLLYVVAVVVGINLLPALSPPTWAILVFFHFRYSGIPLAVLIVSGAAAAAAGRVLLALAFRFLGRWLPQKRQVSLQTLGETAFETRKGVVATFAVFAVSPLPSNQLFEAAGLARVPLRPLVLAFFLGRLASYSIYLTVASAAHQSLSRIFRKGLFSPQAIALELLSILLLVATVLIDWPAVIERFRARRRKRSVA